MPLVLNQSSTTNLLQASIAIVTALLRTRSEIPADSPSLSGNVITTGTWPPSATPGGTVTVISTIPATTGHSLDRLNPRDQIANRNDRQGSLAKSSGLKRDRVSRLRRLSQPPVIPARRQQ